MSRLFKYFYIVLFINLLRIMPAYSQLNNDIKSTIEKYLENTESSADYTQILEDITAFLAKPINLNTSTAEELMAFPLITPIEATAIITHRIKFGYFIDLAELQVIGFSIEHILAIKPFVDTKLNTGQKLSQLNKNLKNGVFEVIETSKLKYPQAGNPAYLGNSLAQNVRLRYAKNGVFSAGLAADKDAGEMWWNKGPDFYSFHAAIYNTGKIKTLIVGDYLISIGQGLVSGAGIGMGKSALVLNIKRNAPVLKPYRGLNEYFFQRGLAAELQWKNWSCLFAASKNKLDARLLDTAQLSSFSALDMDGYHRTSAELANKHTINRQSLGAWGFKKNRNGNWGAGMQYILFDKSIVLSEDLYKLYYPVGNTQMFFNIFQSHSFANVHVFSELAYSASNKRTAAVAGVLAPLGKSVDLSVLYRNYQSGFVSNFSTAFGNASQNENGFYIGLILKINRKLNLSHYTDIWTNPWLGYRSFTPGRGSDMLWQLDFVPIKKALFYLRVRLQSKPGYGTTNAVYYNGTQYQSYTLRMHAVIPFGKNGEWQLRSERNQANQSGNSYKASMSFLQFSNYLVKPKTLFSFRYCIFNVPWFYARIYAFESQLQYDFGTMAFYGKGQSFYVLVNQKVKRFWNIGVRYSLQNTVLAAAGSSSLKHALYLQISYTK